MSTLDQVRQSITQIIGEAAVQHSESTGRLVITRSDLLEPGALAQVGTNVASSVVRDSGLSRYIADIQSAKKRAISTIGDIHDGAILRNKTVTRQSWQMVLRDASEPGKWRIQSFDAKGFSGHMVFAQKTDAIESAVTHGYTVRDDDALDRLFDTPEFQRGLYTTDLIGQVNMGRLDFAQANALLAKYDLVHSALASVVSRGAQAFVAGDGQTMFLLADRIEPGTEGAVFLHEITHKWGKPMMNANSWSRLIGRLQGWAQREVGSIERRIHDRSLVRVDLANVRPHQRNEEFFAYAVEEAVAMGVVPSASAHEDSAQAWLDDVVKTLEQTLLVASTAKADGHIEGFPQNVQQLVDLAYAMAQMESPERAGRIWGRLDASQREQLEELMQRQGLRPTIESMTKGRSPWYFNKLHALIDAAPGRLNGAPAKQWAQWIEVNAPRLLSHQRDRDSLEVIGLMDLLQALAQKPVTTEHLREFVQTGGAFFQESALVETPGNDISGGLQCMNIVLPEELSTLFGTPSDKHQSVARVWIQERKQPGGKRSLLVHEVATLNMGEGRAALALEAFELEMRTQYAEYLIANSMDMNGTEEGRIRLVTRMAKATNFEEILNLLGMHDQHVALKLAASQEAADSGKAGDSPLWEPLVSMVVKRLVTYAASNGFAEVTFANPFTRFNSGLDAVTDSFGLLLTPTGITHDCAVKVARQLVNSQDADHASQGHADTVALGGQMSAKLLSALPVMDTSDAVEQLQVVDAKKPSAPVEVASTHWYFSQLERALMCAPKALQGASGKQWAQWLDANASRLGIKAQELQWTGIREWLDLMHALGRNLQRLDLVEFARSNGVHVQDVVESPAYQQYKPDGGENYREVLLTLPVRVSTAGWTTQAYRIDAWRVFDEHGELVGNFPADDELQALELAKQHRQTAPEQRLGRDFRSQHWSAPNVLAHVRLDDRLDARGQRVLMVHEIQSDWAAAARDSASGTPDAPFIKQPKDWVTLALKRILVMAVEGNYQRVSFATGEQVVERFSTSNELSRIEFTVLAQDAGQVRSVPGRLRTFDLDGNVKRDSDVLDSDLPQIVGKALAQALLADASLVSIPAPSGAMQFVLEGERLKVASQGLARLYDAIIPNAVNDLLVSIHAPDGANWKKVAPLPNEFYPFERGVFKPIPVLDKSFVTAGASAGQPKWTVEFEDGSRHNSAWTDVSIAQAIAKPDMGDRVVPAGRSGMLQPGFDVTAPLREAIGKGVPLFSTNLQVLKTPTGDPLTVYRGEHSGDGQWLKSRLPSLSFGSVHAANTYAQHPNDRQDAQSTDKAQRVMAAHLVMNNPLVNQPDDPFIEMAVLVQAIGLEKTLQIATRFEAAIQETSAWMEHGQGFADVSTFVQARPQDVELFYVDAYLVLDDPEIVGWLQEAGFDGAIHCGNGVSAMELEYRVFSPEQVFPVWSSGSIIDELMLTESGVLARVDAFLDYWQDHEDGPDAPYEDCVSLASQLVREFARSKDVVAEFMPWSPYGSVTGIELTDLYAATPGQGAGSQVMNLLEQVAQRLRLAVYLRPAGERSRQFYARHGYEGSYSLTSASYGFLVKYPVLEDDDEEAPDDEPPSPGGGRPAAHVGAEAASAMFSFAGPSAHGADHASLHLAKAMLASGVLVNVVRQETGWFVGVDGKWRFEIDDKRAFLKGTGNFGEIVMKRHQALDKGANPMYLEEILHHPALFAAYPHLAKLEVEFMPKGATASGQLVGTDVIRVAEQLHSENAISVLMHEIQHAIQYVEGFAIGGSPNEHAWLNQAMRPVLLDATRNAMSNAAPPSYELYWGSERTPEGEAAYAQFLEQWSSPEYQARLEVASQRGAAAQVYAKLAGEIESRDVQARLKLSDAQRNDVAPALLVEDVPSDVIVVFAGLEHDLVADNSLAVPKTLNEVRAIWNTLGIEHHVSEGGGFITLSQIVVPYLQRHQGIGTQAMQALAAYADATGQVVGLSPATDFGGSSKSRLQAFYRRFGFTPNRGRSRDFTTQESMLRQPGVTLNPQFDFSLPKDGNVIRRYRVGYTEIAIDANANTGVVLVASVRTPVTKRGQGSARAALEMLIAQADEQKVDLTLHASALDVRTSQKRLELFYSSLGFANTGRVINPMRDPEMHRAAVHSENEHDFMGGLSQRDSGLIGEPQGIFYSHAVSADLTGTKTLRVQRGQHGSDILRASNGEAGDGIYAFFPKNSAMRRYYTGDGERLWDIDLDASRVIDLTQPQNMVDLLRFAKEQFNELARQMPGYIVPRVNARNIQRFGRIIEQYVRTHRPWAGAWVVPHHGPSAPSGKQVVIAQESVIVAAQSRAHHRVQSHSFLMSVAGAPVIEEFEGAMRPFRDQIYHELITAADCGPFDGGCVCVAMALQQVIGGEVVVLTRAGSGMADHAAVYLNGMLYDFDGPLEPTAFCQRFSTQEFVEISGYRPMTGADLPDASRDAALQARLVQLLGMALASTTLVTQSPSSQTIEEVNMQALFGSSQAPAKAPLPAFKLNLAVLIAEVHEFARDKQALAQQWASRVYKVNTNAIMLEGDGPVRNGSITVSQANESRRRRMIESLTTQAAAATALAARIEAGLDVSTELAGVYAAMQRDIARDGAIPSVYPDQSAMFEAYISSMLLGDGARSFGAGSLAGLIRAAWQTYQEDSETQDDGLRMSYAHNADALIEDIPNQEWLQEQIDYAKGRGLDQYGVPYVGKVTGRFEKVVSLPVGMVSGLKGMRAEQERVRLHDLAAIKQIMQSTGKLPLLGDGKEYAPFVVVAYDGSAWVNEGNHRIMAAAELGWASLPLEIRYFDGGQNVTNGPLFPGKIAKFTMTQTQPFKDWFGSSKVVDHRGQPLVVYHGTDSTNIDEFMGRNWASWFTDSPELAVQYAAEFRSGEGGDETGEGSNVLPVYLSMQNPLNLAFDMNDAAEAARVTVESLGLNWANFSYAFAAHQVVNDDLFIKAAAAAGFDGVVVTERGVRTFAPLNSNQIKSAIGNNGQFDVQSDDILMSVPATKKNGSDDKLLTEKQFYRQYVQHIDLRHREDGKGMERAALIQKQGFLRGFNTNAIPAYSGGLPRNVTDKKFMPLAGDVVYLAPATAWIDGPNGPIIKEGWKPENMHIIQVVTDGVSMYEVYSASVHQQMAGNALQPQDLARSLKTRVLDFAFGNKGITRIESDGMLAATQKKTGRPIFIHQGNFGREQFKQAHAQAQAAGIEFDKMYVFADTATYSGNSIIFMKLDEALPSDAPPKLADAATLFQARMLAAQELSDLVRSTGQRIKTNADGSVTLFHSTSSKNRDAILQEGVFKGNTWFGASKASTMAHAKPKHDSDTVTIELRVDPRDVEFSSGTGEFYAPQGLRRMEMGLWAPHSDKDAPAVDTASAQDAIGGDSSWLVDEQGAPVVFYHGTHAKFETFDMSKSVDGAHFFTTNESHAASFGPVRDYHIKMSRPLVISQDDLDAAWDVEHPDGEQDERSLLARDFVGQFVSRAREEGYDGLIIRQMGDREIQADMYLPLDSTQIGAVDDVDTQLQHGQSAGVQYAKAGEVVDGLVVRTDVPNRSSIPASVTDFTILAGLREIPFEAFTQLGPLKYHSASEQARTLDLAKQIKASGEITPLIVVIDNEGPYVLEGGHRFDALRELGKTSFPALVVLDNESLAEKPVSQDLQQGKPPVQAQSMPVGLQQTSSVEFEQWIKDTKVTNRGGAPKVVYHRTASDFEQFDTTRGDLGTHFGSAEQAANLHGGALRDGERTIAAYLNLKNPIRLVDKGNFHADAVAPQLKRMGLIDAATEKRLFSAGDRGSVIERRQANSEIKQILKGAGYDGVAYKNAQEGKGDSFIAFDPDQIKFAVPLVLSENDVLMSVAAPVKLKTDANGFSYNPDLPAGTVNLDAPQVQRAAQRVIDLEDAASDEWAAGHAAVMEIVRSEVASVEGLDHLEPEQLTHIIKNMVSCQLGQHGRFNVEKTPEFAAYRQAKAALTAEQTRYHQVVAENSGRPHRESMAQLDEFDRPLTKTAQFKDWFKHSQVVDDQGVPLIAFHGTAYDIRRFKSPTKVDARKHVANQLWMGDLGNWFAAPSQDETLYEDGNAEATADVFAERKGGKGGGVIYPVFLSIQNPMEFFDYEELDYASQTYASSADMRQKLIALGYDGIVIRDCSTDGNQFRDDWVSFFPSQIKSALSGFSNQDDDVLMSVAAPKQVVDKQVSALGLFSALRRQVDKLEMSGATAQAWDERIAGLVKKGLAKESEVQWSGLSDWLALQTGRVTKEQIVEFLDANGVQVQETVMGQKVHTEFSVRQRGDTFEVVGYLGGVIASDVSEEEANELRDYYQETYGDGYKGAQPKYAQAQYTLPGGENYREVLLTLPSKLSDYGTWLDGSPVTAEDIATEEGRQTAQRVAGVTSFETSHWPGYSNILAHLRVTDRTDSDGSRVLFVEEIQSDWAQKGRKEGFSSTAQDDARLIEVEKQIALARQHPGEPYRVVPLNNAQGEVEYWVVKGNGAQAIHVISFSMELIAKARAHELNRQDAAPDMKALYEERDRLEHKRAVKANTPSGPFVETTTAWVSLALKRIITMAVDGGYDKVAFINGEQSSARYELSKDVEYVRATALGDDRYNVAAFKARGEAASVNEYEVSIRRVEAVFGKELAKKIQASAVGEIAEFSGDDLVVGGFGMKAFYDTVLPSVAKELLRKIDGSKIQSFEVGAVVENPTFGMTTYKVVDGKMVGANDVNQTMFETMGLQNGFVITDELRELVQKDGLPLFSFAGPTAQTALRGDLDVAQSRLAAGEDANLVRQQTGWFVGADGKWRFEISDAGAALGADLLMQRTLLSQKLAAMEMQGGALLSSLRRAVGSGKQTPEEASAQMRAMQWQIKQIREDLDAVVVTDSAKRVQVGGYYKLQDVLSHPALFAAYPELGEIQVHGVDGDSSNKFGSFEAGAGITINARLSSDDSLSVLLHELQHAVQEIEGFARGGDFQNIAPELTQAFRQSREDAALDEYRAADKAYRANKSPQNRLRFEVAAGALESVGPAPSAEDSYQAYLRLGGEVEARNVQTRRMMDANQRRVVSPAATADTPDVEVIVVLNGQEMSGRKMFAQAPKSESADVVYHVTPVSNLAKILDQGIAPQIGKRASLAGETAAASYHFHDVRELDDALMGWLDDAFDEKEDLAILAVDVSGLRTSRTDSSMQVPGYELQVFDYITPDRLMVTSKNMHTLDAKGLAKRCASTAKELEHRREQQRQREGNLKAWAGRTKVCDDSGSPKVVYHSTVADFNTFKRNPKDIGMHFGTAGQALDRFDLKAKRDVFSQRHMHSTMPVYLKIENPLRLKDLRFWDHDNLISALPEEFAGQTYGLKTLAQVRNLIKSHGYDGIVYKNTGETQGGAELRNKQESAWEAVKKQFPRKRSFSHEEQQHPLYVAYKEALNDYTEFRQRNSEDSWIVFEPQQIKSATGNFGTFNPKLADIRMSFAGEKACGADLSVLSLAKMVADGSSTWDAYGWTIGPDGLWRFEIDDSLARADVDALKSLQLGGFPDGLDLKKVVYRFHPSGKCELLLVPPNPQKLTDMAHFKAISKGVVKDLLSPDLLERMLAGEGQEDLIGDFEPAKMIESPGMRLQPFNALPLSMVLDHPALFAAYPILTDVMVTVSPEQKQAACLISPAASKKAHDEPFVVSLRSVGYGEKHLRSMLLHEVQHVIQGVEGFAPGGTGDSALELQKQMQFQVTEQALARMQAMKERFPLTHEAYKAVNDNLYMLLSQHRISAFDANGQSRPMMEMTRELKAVQLPGQVQQRRALIAEYTRCMDYEVGQYGTHDYEQWMAAVQALTVAQNQVLEPAEVLYRRLGGEVESRNVQARMLYTAEQRREKTPDTTADVACVDQLLRWNC